MVYETIIWQIKKRSYSTRREECAICMCRKAGRSQMAEGFFRKYAPRGYSALSAGTKPSGEINPLRYKL